MRESALTRSAATPGQSGSIGTEMASRRGLARLVRPSGSGNCDSEAIQIKEAIKRLLEDIGVVVCKGSHLKQQVAGLETVGHGTGLVSDHFSQMSGLQFYGTPEGAYKQARVANSDCLVPDDRPQEDNRTEDGHNCTERKDAARPLMCNVCRRHTDN